MAHLFTFIGIDPGKTGGIAVITDDGHRLVSREMPLSKEYGISAAGIHETLRFATDVTSRSRVYLEKSQSMPGQGVKSTFNYGTGYGKILAVLELLELDVVYVRPHVWKKAMGLNKKGKISSCKMASSLFPNANLQTPLGRLKDGEAEALLLAEYGRRISGGIV